VLDQGLCIGLSFACHLNYKKGVVVSQDFF